MRPLFHAQLVNDVFGDPGLLVEPMFERRALLFDLGDISTLPARRLLKISDVFVTHAHMDHFCGFDTLLRLCLGRDKRLALNGPPDFIAQTGHKLAAYSWNLVHNYPADFTVAVTEIHPDGTTRAAAFHCAEAFARRDLPPGRLAGDSLLDEPGLRVRVAVLDHDIPCLGYTLEEKAHVNVWKNRLDALGLPVGPWLKRLKQAVLDGVADDAPIVVTPGRTLPLGRLKADVLRVVPGQKIAYFTDIVYHEANAARMAALAADADLLFIETPFLDAEAAMARRKCHLTARQAGIVARRARARRMVPFHFSPRYAGRAGELRAEAEAAFQGTAGTMLGPV